ncbi:hypothetical protein I3842_02G140600 [Carya illinoinensis]|nr:hypothetical protein I3842_02G140600 [Carya illinoinensis]
MMYVTCGSSVYKHNIYGREAPSSNSSSLAGFSVEYVVCWVFLTSQFTSADNGQSATHDHARRTYEQI